MCLFSSSVTCKGLRVYRGVVASGCFKIQRVCRDCRDPETFIGSSERRTCSLELRDFKFRGLGLGA